MSKIDHDLYEPVVVPIINTDWSDRVAMSEHLSEYSYKEYPRTIRPPRGHHGRVEIYWRKREQPK